MGDRRSVPGHPPAAIEGADGRSERRLSKRDGCRVLYRIDEVRRVVYLARIYHKSERPDVTPAELERANREVRSLEEQEEFRGKLKGRRA